MALIKCKECDGQVAASAASCPHCGAPAPGSSRASYLWLLIGLPVGGVVLFLGFGLLSLTPEKSRDRGVIAECWRTTDTIMPGTSARDLAQRTCESLVDQFEARHGPSPSLRHN